jgi:hypothetical protein
MAAFRSAVSSHYMHTACIVAAVLVLAAIVFGIAPLAILGALFCGAMMIGMMWMMVGMARKGHS